MNMDKMLENIAEEKIEEIEESDATQEEVDEIIDEMSGLLPDEFLEMVKNRVDVEGE